MKKKLLSALLAAAMLISAIPSAMAAKKVEEGGGTNIYKDIGSLETTEQLAKYNPSQATASIEDGGVEGDFCAKVSVTGDWGGLRIPMPSVVGETYDISFYIKTDAAEATMTPIMYYQGASYAFLPTGRFTNGWTKYSTTWECTGISHNGSVSPTGSGEIDIRYGNGQQHETYYVDNIVVQPHGNVPDADYSSLKLTGANVKKPVSADSEAPIDVALVAFADMGNHWAKDTVNQLATYGYIEGMGDNIYSPDTNVTRAQFVKMMTDMFDVLDPAYNASYADIKGDEWFAPSVSLATTIGLIDSAITFGNRFLPDQAITREEAASIAAKMAAYKQAEKKTEGVSFTDDAAISTWAKAAVKDAAEYGLIKGYEDGSYRPAANITRAEAATILKRIAEFSTLFAVYVDADTGNDKNDGTQEAPLKTIYEARERVDAVNETMKNDIYVYIRGEHYLDKTFKLGPEDSGRNNYRVIYTSWGDEKPTLTMGKKYTGFTLHDEDLNIYKVFVGSAQSRQAYFNNVRGIRARNVDGFKNPKWIPSDTHLTYHTENTELLDFAYPTEIEGVWHSNWRHTRILLESVTDIGDGLVEIKPTQKFKNYTYDKWKDISDHRRFPTYLENAYEFLDQPSEWYLDSHAGYLYYIPREGEDMSTMVATLPVGESMMEVTSSTNTDVVRNITFNNIEFADTGYMRTTNNGGSNVMQNYTFTESGEPDNGMPLHALLFTNAHYIDFTNNRLTRMGSSGLLTSLSIQHCNFMGNEFFDISGNGMNLGNPTSGYGGTDPALPTSEKEWNAWNKVHNNFFYGTGLEYGSAAALGAAFPRHTTISYNYFGTTPYSGMHTGWGWGGHAAKGTNTYDFEVSHNYFSETNNDRLYDGAGIYMLGSTSLEAMGVENNNRLYQNYFENPRNAYGAVYPDEGSTYWHIYENVINMKDVKNWRFNFDDIATYDKTKIHWLMLWATTCKYNNVDNNYSTTNVIRDTTGSDTNNLQDSFVYPDADWPEEAQAIIDGAYIQPAYLDNFDKKDGPLSFVSRERQYDVPMGEKVPLDFKIYGNYMEEYDPADFDIDYWVSDPDVLTVDENGVMEAIGTGEVRVVANANINGFIQVKEYKVYAGEKYEELNTNVGSLNMLAGYSTGLKVNAVTTFGRTAEVEASKVTYSVADESIATVNADGIVTAIQPGATTVKVIAEDFGFKIEKEVPVTVITLTRPDSLELPYNEGTKIYNGSWTGKTTKVGSKLSASGSPNYCLQRLDNELVAFDMSIENPNSWPSLALCAPDQMASYEDGDTYLIGFKPEFIEVQRFNNGKRTMIFGEANYNPVGGPGIPNSPDAPIYQYGEENTFSVIVGALAHAEGTRLVLTINGVNVFDYIDTDPNALEPKGLFGVYNSGTFTFSPYTGRTAAPAAE